jgi:hypothetical protein
MSSALGAYAPNHHLTVYEPYRARYGQAPGNATYDQPGCERYGTPTVPVRYPIYERLFHPAQQTQSRASYLPPRPEFGGSMPPPAVFNEPWAKSPFRNQSETGLDGLAGRGGCDSKQVFEALLELTCGPRPTERNISARA